MAFHNGTPFEFLWRMSADETSETWTVRTIFVDRSVTLTIKVRNGDPLRPIHTQHQ